jgi:hypothetical protein
MKRKVAVVFVLLLVVIPARVFGKGDISKITIQGPDLETPIAITDPKTLPHFTVRNGPGISGPGLNKAHNFIIDWSQPVTERPQGLSTERALESRIAMLCGNIHRR